jgi:hypothetical protein
MIYGICAIAFNVVMSYDCIMYALCHRSCRGTAHRSIELLKRLSNKHKIVIENMHDDDSGQYI